MSITINLLLSRPLTLNGQCCIRQRAEHSIGRYDKILIGADVTTNQRHMTLMTNDVRTELNFCEVCLQADVWGGLSEQQGAFQKRLRARKYGST